jgi:hypothetical protein
MDILVLIQTHPYLFASALMIALCLVAGRVLLTGEQFRAIVLSGLLGAPCFIFMPFLEDTYWTPRRAGRHALGFEDLLISFAVAVMAWLVVALFLRRRIRVVRRARGFHRRYSVAGLLSVGFFLGLCGAGIDAMVSLVLAYVAMVAILQIVRKDLWPVALTGLVAFPLLYLVVLRVDYWLWPGFISEWNQASVLGAALWGFPRGELLWAVAFGAYWPLFVGYTCNIRLVFSTTPSQAAE